MPSERSLADFDRQVFITCGKKAMVVSEAAIKPMAVIKGSAIPTRDISKRDCWHPK